MRATWKLLFLSLLLAALALEPCRCQDDSHVDESSDEERLDADADEDEQIEAEEEEEFHDHQEQDFELLEEEQDKEQFDLEEEDEELLLLEFDEDEWDHQDDQSPPLDITKIEVEQTQPSEKAEQSPPIALPKVVEMEHKQQPEKNLPSAAQTYPVVSSDDLEVIQLSSSTFSKVTADDNIWLIEFYADWCKHCVQFGPTYAEVARHFHSQPHLKVKVARVNVDHERALALRFGVNSFPSFYLINQWSAYQFDQARSKKNLVDFASGGYKKQDTMPWLLSPMGPLGLAQGALVGAGSKLSNVFYWLQDRFGLSSLVAGTLMFGSFFTSFFFFIVFCAIAFTPKEKID